MLLQLVLLTFSTITAIWGIRDLYSPNPVPWRCLLFALGTILAWIAIL